jgi:hypothetical protein
MVIVQVTNEMPSRMNPSVLPMPGPAMREQCKMQLPSLDCDRITDDMQAFNILNLAVELSTYSPY